MPRRNDISKILIMILRLAALVCLMVLGTATATACSIAFPRYKVQSRFWAVVHHDNHAVPSIEVALYRDRDMKGSEWHPFLTRSSDRDGTVKFEGLEVGKYFIIIKGLGGGEAAELEVDAVETWESRNEIRLGWPGVNVLKTTTLKGHLVSNDTHSPFASVQVKLWKTGIAAALDSLQTGPDGQFEFNQHEPGIYLLEVAAIRKRPAVKDDGDAHGWIGVELLPAGTPGAESLDLALGETTCGLTYSECVPAPPIQLASRKLMVVDPNGAAVRSTYNVTTLDSRSGTRPRQTNDSGRSEFPADLKGERKLYVASEGFVSLEQDIEFVSTNPKAPALKIILATQGSGVNCSKAILESDAEKK